MYLHFPANLIMKNHGKQKNRLSIENYVDGVLSGDRTVLSQVITLIESKLQEDLEIAQKVVEKCLPHSGNSIRLGITGVPGVGKSTFIELLGVYLAKDLKKRVSVLAIDPTSNISKGSIMGDKVRMPKLSQEDNAYIRPSPTSGFLGGVGNKTRESIILLEAAGFDVVIVETVGVGQSELKVHSMVDFFLLLMLAGAGDELQGIKRGIMEVADSIVITKADGSNRSSAKTAKKDFETALKLFPHSESGWVPKVLTCSALENTGIKDIWDIIEDFYNKFMENGYLEDKRREQAKFWLHDSIFEMLKDSFYNNSEVSSAIERVEKDLSKGKLSSFAAAKKLYNIYKN